MIPYVFMMRIIRRRLFFLPPLLPSFLHPFHFFPLRTYASLYILPDRTGAVLLAPNPFPQESFPFLPPFMTWGAPVNGFDAIEADKSVAFSR